MGKELKSMLKTEFVKTVPYLESTKQSRVLVVHGVNYFGELISPLIIEKFAEDNVKDQLTVLQHSKTEVIAISHYLLGEGYIEVRLKKR